MACGIHLRLYDVAGPIPWSTQTIQALLMSLWLHFAGIGYEHFSEGVQDFWTNLPRLIEAHPDHQYRQFLFRDTSIFLWRSSSWGVAIVCQPPYSHQEPAAGK